jgi:hypothetical protein
MVGDYLSFRFFGLSYGRIVGGEVYGGYHQIEACQI